ncbi:MAG TPA: hypothetical protein VK699_21165 [Terriglobales bacterium]|jgi:hypothetical protein|nr:hypothetical protein [Terriglobales bacterium]
MLTDKEKYKVALDELRERYVEVWDERHQLTKEMIGLSKSIEGLSALCGEDPEIPPIDSPDEFDLVRAMAAAWLKHMAFADACRTALRIVYPTALTPSDVRGMLTLAGYPLERRTDPMVAINVCLKRLVDSEEAEVVSLPNGRKAYRWAFKNEMPPLPNASTVDWEKLIGQEWGEKD